MVIPWEDLDETNQSNTDDFHTYMKEGENYGYYLLFHKFNQ